MGEPTNNMATLKCGSKPAWIGATVCCLILGIVFIAIAGAMGGCSCAGECIWQCSGVYNLLGGCEKGDFDAASCGTSLGRCTDACTLGGLSTGAKASPPPRAATQAGVPAGTFGALVATGVILIILSSV